MEKFYAYILTNSSGPEIKGIVNTWDECLSLTKGNSAKYRKFKSLKEAESFIANNGILIFEEGIYFDSRTLSETTEARITNEKRESLLKNLKDIDVLNALDLSSNDDISSFKINQEGNILLPNRTNNFGALMGLKIALILARKYNIKKIFGNSKLILDYWSQGQINQNLPEETLVLAAEVKRLRKAFEANNGSVSYISHDLTIKEELSIVEEDLNEINDQDKNLKIKGKKKKPSNKAFKFEEGIYFDGGTGSGITEARVADEKRQSLLENLKDIDVLNRLNGFKINKRGNISLQGRTNNFAELMGLKIALILAKKYKVKKIFGDSKLVLDYWSKGYIKQTLPEETITLASEVKALRKDFQANGGKLSYIPGSLNPADLGFHK